MLLFTASINLATLWNRNVLCAAFLVFNVVEITGLLGSVCAMLSLQKYMA